MIDEQIDESLSALVDGELPRARAQQVLDRVVGDDELRERWRRHHLISAALSSQHSLLVADDGLASRISAALDAEPVPLRRPTRRVSWTVGLAAAASVAALAVLITFGVSGQRSTTSRVPPLAALSSNAPRSGVAVVVPAADSRIAVTPASPVITQDPGVALTRMTWNDARPAVEARLNGYLLDHSEYLADGVHGMLPYARVVGYDARN